jgi:hypothetical protein
MCTRGLTDPAYPKYPRLPVRACPGYGTGGGEAAAGEAGTPPDAAPSADAETPPPTPAPE